MALKDVTLDSLSAASAFVKRTRNARWENYDILMFRPTPNAYMHKRGTFDRRTGRWGFTYRYPVSPNGTWDVKVFEHGSK